MSNISFSNISLPSSSLSPLSAEFLLSHYNFSFLLPTNLSNISYEIPPSNQLVITNLGNLGNSFFKLFKNKLGFFTPLEFSPLGQITHNFTVLHARDLKSLLSHWRTVHPEHAQIAFLIEQCIETENVFLNLSRQKLKVLDEQLIEILSHLTWLKILKLDFNELEEIPYNAFAELSNLTTLFLNHNRLTNLPPTLFQNLPQLSTLYLNNNQLSALHSTIFDGQTLLHSLFLEENLFRALPTEIFNGLVHHAAVHLDANLEPEFYFDLPKHIDVYPCGYHLDGITK